MTGEQKFSEKLVTVFLYSAKPVSHESSIRRSRGLACTATRLVDEITALASSCVPVTSQMGGVGSEAARISPAVCYDATVWNGHSHEVDRGMLQRTESWKMSAYVLVRLREDEQSGIWC